MGRSRIIKLDELVERLEAFEQDVITLDRIVDFLSELRIDDASLRPHLHFRDERYTRNLVFRDDLFEVMLLCWQPGQKTPVHTHNGQLGWMLVERGGIQVENFRHLGCSTPERQNVVGLDCLAGGTEVRLESLDRQLVEEGGPIGTVDKIQTIHRIDCPADGEPAVTLHIYSRPFESCVTFDLERGVCSRRNLFWDTLYGKPVEAGGGVSPDP